MASTLTAVNATPGVTYTDPFYGDPFRCDGSGIMHVPTATLTAFTSKNPSITTASATDIKNKKPGEAVQQVITVTKN